MTSIPVAAVQECSTFHYIQLISFVIKFIFQFMVVANGFQYLRAVKYITPAGVSQW